MRYVSHRELAGSSEPSASQIIREELASRRNAIALIILFTCANTIVALISPLLVRLLLDEAVPNSNTALAIAIVLGLVVVPILATALSAAQAYQRAMIGEIVSQSLRRKVLHQVVGSTFPAFRALKTGEVVQRVTRGCGEIGEVYISNQLLPMFSNALLLLGYSIVMLWLNPYLAAIVFIAFPLSLVLSDVIKKRAKLVNDQLMAVLENGMSLVQQILFGWKTTKSLTGEALVQAKWVSWLESHTEIKAKAAVLHTVMLTLPSTLINNVTLGIVYGFAAFSIMRGELSVGDMVAFAAYVPSAYAALQALVVSRVSTGEVRSAIERVDTLLRLPSERQGGRVLPRGPKSVEFSGVAFAYEPGSFSLTGINLSIEPGEFCAIVGRTGSGKSTLLDLLMGFLDSYQGTIRLDRQDLRDTSLHSLRQVVGYVPQDVFVWNDTIRNNLIYPLSHVNEESLVKAAVQAQLHHFVMSLPNGYETVIGDGARQLSGGERQRLGICRALLRSPGLLLMDEPTSALDASTEEEVRKAIENAASSRTTIVVSHRLSTIMGADTVVVMDDGKIVERGSPGELLRQEGAFHAMFRSQSLSVEQFQT